MKQDIKKFKRILKSFWIEIENEYSKDGYYFILIPCINNQTDLSSTLFEKLKEFKYTVGIDCKDRWGEERLYFDFVIKEVI